MHEQTYHIHLRGRVQGVGFRPFVFRLATQYGLRGWVNNAADGVHIAVNATETAIGAFYRDLLGQAPALSRITAHSLHAVHYSPFSTFEIVHSETKQAPDLLLTPDFALCSDCRRELSDPSNRRRGYAFITCTLCGPRYSIMERLPYDRERTTMAPFSLCEACNREYNDVADRRYFSQTNSCPVCGIRLELYDAAGPLAKDPLPATIEALRTGEIVAVKGIGGYLLLCDATRPETVRRLRTRKRRPTKPFAVLYPRLEMLEADAWIREEERLLLQQEQAPIVLLRTKPAPGSGICLHEVAPSLGHIGAMLPYTPLFELIAAALDRPLVATSGNLSGSPVLYEDAAARAGLLGVADLLLGYNRAIVVPQDDSVVRISAQAALPIVLRRSRGLAPSYLNPLLATPPAPASVLALGAMMKSAFAWLHRGNWYLSQYLGDLEGYDTQLSFEHTLRHFTRLLEARPNALVCDRHPGYYSTQLAERLSAEWQVPLLRVQHHEAHFAAVLGENGLAGSDEPVLGIVWDGTGYGDDGQVWGGEFFRYASGKISRLTHLAYFDFLLGDKMPREPRMSALSLLRAAKTEAAKYLRPAFSATEWDLYNKMLDRRGLLQTSSMGRLFDGVAALLGLAYRVSYEGEAALLLETMATRQAEAPGTRLPGPYPCTVTPGHDIPVGEIVRGVIADVDAGVEPGLVALRFHVTLVEVIRAVARQSGCRRLAFSGGVFQNALLADLVQAGLGADYSLYFHRQLSPNDEGVAFGQLIFSQHVAGG